MAKHFAKGKLFTLAYKRAIRASKSGFYLEAVSLTDSLIVDRLKSVIRANLEVDTDRMSVGKAASLLIKHDVHDFDAGLWQDCLSWSRKRNHLSHGMAHLGDGGSLNWRRRLKQGHETALEGIKLVNRLSDESRKHKI